LRKSRADEPLISYLASPQAAVIWGGPGRLRVTRRGPGPVGMPGEISRSIARSIIEAGGMTA